MSSTDSNVTGWKGKLLRIDLSSGNTSVENLSDKLLAEYVGGRGLASKILADEVDPAVDPLGPDNKVVLSAGPLVGTIAPGASRTQVVTRSPLTGRISSLNVGGHFGAAMRSAGYDVLVVEGRSDEPVYLRVDGDLVEVRDAKELWGQTVSETQAALRALTDKEPRQAALPSRNRRPTSRAIAGERAELLCIGPSGERQDAIASLVGSEHWSAGGAGLGAVLGSKNVKAIAVSGSVPATVADGPAFSQAVAASMDRLKSSYVYYRRLAAYGTGALVRMADSRGALPSMNFRAGSFAEVNSISGEVVADSILKKTTACFGCPSACGRRSALNGSDVAGPEYEHLVGFGSNCGVADPQAIARAAHICRENGFDALSAAAAVAEALELAESGALPEMDCGPNLKPGAAGMIELVEQMAEGQGLGEILRQGPQALAERFARPEVFVGLSGQALAPYDPRGDDVMGLCHATGGEVAALIPRALLAERSQSDDVVSEALRLQDLAAVIDSAGLCPHIAATFSLAEISGLLSAATGVDYSEANLRSSAAAIWLVERKFGAGVDEGLPARLSQPLDQGSALRANEVLPAYYRARNWEA